MSQFGRDVAANSIGTRGWFGGSFRIVANLELDEKEFAILASKNTSSCDFSPICHQYADGISFENVLKGDSKKPDKSQLGFGQ